MKEGNIMEITVDKRLEFLTALVVAYKEKIAQNKDEFDWVEYPDNDYVRSLIKQISIENHPEIYPFLDSIWAEDLYTELYFYLDEEMNYKEKFNKKAPFNNLNIEDFCKIIHQIYIRENIKDFFEYHSQDLNQLVQYTKSIMFSKEEVTMALQELYKIRIPNSHIVVSLLFNGGFGPSYKGESYCLRGVGFENGKYILSGDHLKQNFFHEASHPLVNPLIDKYYEDFKFDEALLKEVINKGLPTCYSSLKTLLYEYFVRVNENYLVKKYISKERYLNSIAWVKSIGFIYIEELIVVLEKSKAFYNNYEEVLVHELLPCLEEHNLKLKKQQPHT